MTVQQVLSGDPDGVQFPNTKLGFFAITPVAQRSTTTGHTAVSTSAAVSGAFGYTSSQANAISAAVAEIQATLKAYGLWPT